MQEYGFSQTRVFPYKNGIEEFVLIRENAGHRKLVFWHILRSLNVIIDITHCILSTTIRSLKNQVSTMVDLCNSKLILKLVVRYVVAHLKRVPR